MKHSNPQVASQTIHFFVLLGECLEELKEYLLRAFNLQENIDYLYLPRHFKIIMDPVICAQLILSRMKNSGELDDILVSALRPSFRRNWYETQTYEHASLPEGYFDDMIQYIIEESANWSVTDYNAHCLVLCLLQQKIIISMGLDITHPTDVRGSCPETTTQLTTPH